MKNVYPLDAISPVPPLRYSTGFLGFDKLLGADEHGSGLVKGSTLILSGTPGAGKSTMLIQLAHQLANGFDRKVLYINGEENKEQIKMRAERLGINSGKILLNEDIEINTIQQNITQICPQIVIVDSLQMLYSDKLKTAPNTPTQLKNALLTLCVLAKRLQVTIIFVGHSTKGGYIAGLQTLQHMVDVVLYLGLDEVTNEVRLLEAKKNRFGAIDYIWKLYMTAHGLTDDPKSDVNKLVPAQSYTITNEQLVRLGNRSFLGAFLTQFYLKWLQNELKKDGLTNKM